MSGHRGPRLDHLKPDLRKKVNKALVEAGFDGNGRFQNRGMAKMIEILNKYGLDLYDGRQINQFVGDEGRLVFKLTHLDLGQEIVNSVLAVTWYKKPSGFEVVSYLS